jgi:hypothetical protein
MESLESSEKEEALAHEPPKGEIAVKGESTQEEDIAVLMAAQAGSGASSAPVTSSVIERRKVIEHKDLGLGGFGIRLAEANGPENDSSVPRVLVEVASRSGQLGAGDR